MQFPIFITLVTLFIYQVLSICVSAARGKYNIKAPATTGNINFERVYRTHLNYLENLVIFLPLVWIGSFEFSSILYLENLRLILSLPLSALPLWQITEIIGALIYVLACLSWLVGKGFFSIAYIKNWAFKTKLTFNIVATASTLILFILGIISLF